jgi:hypothetical protein
MHQSIGPLPDGPLFFSHQTSCSVVTGTSRCYLQVLFSAGDVERSQAITIFRSAFTRGCSASHCATSN